ncbi:tRNA (adenine(22)-N(1))-methyltransferase [Fictibacillus iocasae]|uniref:tRNA (Adenine(22)-N(1))-methyltransferase n=1 Tax=Fictibacillus iocasae TaxID=2715437 RepID=A0ABW2NSK2_9BACL
MNEQNLSRRLTAVANHVENGMKVADIGSDHAYLPCYLAVQNKISFAVAGEVTDGPLQSAQEQVKSLQMEHVINVRKGDGLEVIAPGEVDAVTICGMGGILIASILEKGKDKLEGVSKLILQPNVAAKWVREWLEKEDWVLTAEEILKEDGKIYEVLVAEKAGTSPYSVQGKEKELLFGPYLLKEKSDVFQEKWSGEKKQWNNILSQMNNSESPETEQRKKDLQYKISLAEEILS